MWRLVAVLILVGTVADGTLGALFLSDISKTIPFGYLHAIYWIPPALERPTVLLRILSRLHPTTAWTVLLLTVILSLLLARGPWKERVWAGWVETALMLPFGLALVNNWRQYFAGRGAHPLRDFFTVGNGQALVWMLVIIALLWTHQLIRLSGTWKGLESESAVR